MTDNLPTSKRSQALSEAGAPPPPEKMPAEKLKQIKQAAEAQIDEFMRQVGYNPAERTDEQGWRWLKLGSAEGRAGVVESNGELYLCAEALVMPLPSDKELILPFMRELLEMNMSIAGSARLGIKNEAVFIAVTRPVVELRANDFANCIHSVMAMADGLDNPLIEKYGGTSKKRAPSAKTPKPATKSRKKGS